MKEEEEEEEEKEEEKEDEKEEVLEGVFGRSQGSTTCLGGDECGGAMRAPEMYIRAGVDSGAWDLKLRRLRKQFHTSYIVFWDLQQLIVAYGLNYIYSYSASHCD